MERERFDVVILDEEMPGVSGLDLLSFPQHRLPAVPVIFITAFGRASGHQPLFKVDHHRAIDRYIDYFGGATVCRPEPFPPRRHGRDDHMGA